MATVTESVAAAGQSKGIDRPLFIAVLLLVAFGLVMVYSASAVMAAQRLHQPAYFLIRQVIYASAGIIVMLVVSRIDYHFYRKVVYPFLGLAVLGLLACHTPLGMTINGAARWLDVGPITVQPSEFVKVALVMWLSYSLAKKSLKIKSFSIGFLPHLIVPGVVILLCLLQPDFGTSVVIAVLTFTLLFVAGAKLGYMMAAGIVAAPIAYALVAGSEYRLKRLLTFLDPLASRFGDGYQLSQSMFGFGAGGVTGVGLGDGLQKFLFLPEAHNDFIASIIAEELGMVGIWGLIILFAIVVARGVRIGIRAKDEFGTYLAMGLTILLGVQVLFNLGVAMGLLPTKGLNLPFVSFGGSALVVSLFAVGVLLNVSREKDAPADQLETDRASQGNVRRSRVTEAPEEAR
ncbi:MAG: putative lipid II flippase FtsW [Deltaproteobacteria bacterium]|nr:putative lipid II flippase FtsW [Deltaproteobacteria bacterium]